MPPSCHTCPHDGKKSTACIRCPGPADTNHKGQTFVSIDAGDDPQTLGEVEASAARRQFTRAVADPHEDACNLSNEAVEIARRIAYAFTDLSPTDFILVKRLMLGESMAAVARSRGLTRAAISARVKGIVARAPAFRFLRLES